MRKIRLITCSRAWRHIAESRVVRLAGICGLFGLMFVTAAAAQSGQVVVEVSGIRSDAGNILVMATPEGAEAPVYGMAKAARGRVQVLLEGLPKGRCEISVFHDANCDYRLDMDAQGRPTEGVARGGQVLQSEPDTCRMKLFYLPNR